MADKSKFYVKRITAPPQEAEKENKIFSWPQHSSQETTVELCDSVIQDSWNDTKILFDGTKIKSLCLKVAEMCLIERFKYILHSNYFCSFKIWTQGHHQWHRDKVSTSCNSKDGTGAIWGGCNVGLVQYGGAIWGCLPGYGTSWLRCQIHIHMENIWVCYVGLQMLEVKHGATMWGVFDRTFMTHPDWDALHTCMLKTMGCTVEEGCSKTFHPNQTSSFCLEQNLRWSHLHLVVGGSCLALLQRKNIWRNQTLFRRDDDQWKPFTEPNIGFLCWIESETELFASGCFGLFLEEKVSEETKACLKESVWKPFIEPASRFCLEKNLIWSHLDLVATAIAWGKKERKKERKKEKLPPVTFPITRKGEGERWGVKPTKPTVH